MEAIAGNWQGFMCIENTIFVQGRCNDDPRSRTVSIVITDSCPECESDHLDLQVSFICQIRQILCRPERTVNVIKIARLELHMSASAAVLDCSELAGCDGAMTLFMCTFRRQKH